MKILSCQMRAECLREVTHIDEKGFIYCKEHGKARQYSMRCRKLTKEELTQLENGKPLKRY